MHIDSVEGFLWYKQRLLVQKKTLSFIWYTTVNRLWAISRARDF